MPPGKDSIARLPLALARLTGNTPPSARQIYEMVLRGVIPAVFETGRWYFSEADVQLIAERLGLRVTPDAAAPVV